MNESYFVKKLFKFLYSYGRTIVSKEQRCEMLCGNFRSMRQANPTNKPPPNLWNMKWYIGKSWSDTLMNCWEITFRLPESPPWKNDFPRFPFVKSSNISESFLMASCGIWMTYRLDALIEKFWSLVLDDQLVKSQVTIWVTLTSGGIDPCCWFSASTLGWIFLPLV